MSAFKKVSNRGSLNRESLGLSVSPITVEVFNKFQATSDFFLGGGGGGITSRVRVRKLFLHPTKFCSAWVSRLKKDQPLTNQNLCNFFPDAYLRPSFSRGFAVSEFFHKIWGMIFTNVT